MGQLTTNVVGLLSLILALVFYLASTDITKNLSPQGCRMSWMSPSYILQSGFNTSWSPLANRYSLWLYREVGWEGTPVNGLPVLFIPGNAGSSHQVRSIASSATRQFYHSPYVVDGDSARGGAKPLDFYTAEFNEDLSAFHGPTLDSQISYSSQAISYILSLYPPNTQIIVMGHSMGGVVATSLLPSPDISAIITMSTPHTLPPARFDARIEKIYARNHQLLLIDPTPIISLCGGATDMMIPSESCILPAVSLNHSKRVHRKTVFTSALEGSWTGVGHREMVWCHQIRWRVARAALELGKSSSTQDRATILDRWFRDGNDFPSNVSPPSEMILTNSSAFEILPSNKHLVLKRPQLLQTYLFPVSPAEANLSSKFVLYMSQGSIMSVSPQRRGALRASVYICHNQGVMLQSEWTAPICVTKSPNFLKLLPNPIPGRLFPVPGEGSDESEGVVFFEIDLVGHVHASDNTWVAVRVEDADGDGWLMGGFTTHSSAGDGILKNEAGALVPFFGKVSINIPESSQDVTLKTEIQIPNLLSHALIVYRVIPKSISAESRIACAESLFPPLLMHTTFPSESHYFPLVHSPPHPLLLHSHSSAPYIPEVRAIQSSGVNLTLYSLASTNCITGFDIRIDWWSTFGRWGSRYSMTFLSWAVGVVSLVVFRAWCKTTIPSASQSLGAFMLNDLPKLLIGSYAVGLLPFPANYYMGTKGEPLIAPVAPLLVFIVAGLVYTSWWIIVLLLWPLSRLGRLLPRSSTSSGSGSTGTLASMGLIFLLIFIFIPWQVAFLGCWIIHLHTCATSRIRFPPVDHHAAIPLIIRPQTESGDTVTPQSARDAIELDPGKSTIEGNTSLEIHHRNMHIMLLMTWLLPLVAPVLAVWVRTLMTAGLTVPFGGDHNFLNVAPFLLLVDSLSSNGKLDLNESRWNRQLAQGSFVALALASFFLGPRTTYIVFDVANLVAALLVFLIRGRSWRTSIYLLIPKLSR